MIEYDPPIKNRDTDELIKIANAKTGDWLSDAIEQAKAELKRRRISLDEQTKKINDWNDKLKQEDNEYKINLQRESKIGYTKIQMIKIFFLSLFLVTSKFSSLGTGKSLFYLWENNFLIKFRQRLILLISGLVFWIIIGFCFYKYDDYKRMKKIEQIDISGWEKNRIKDNK